MRERSPLMFSFMRKSGPRSPSAAIRRALEKDGLLSASDTVPTLSVVESRGRYAGRKVTYIRVFDSVRAENRGLHVRAYTDLDSHADLVLRAGHVEEDGDVTFNWRAPSATTVAPIRTDGDRAGHDDDERF